MALAAHHAAVDGLSFATASRDLESLYHGFATGDATDGALPTLGAGYRDFAAWQARCIEEGSWKDQLAWWRETLAGLPPLARARLPGAGEASGLAGTVTRPLPPDLLIALRRRARAVGATEFMVLLTAWVATLRRCTGQLDFAVITPVGAVVEPTMQGVVGMFLNRVLLRCDCGGSTTLQQLLERMRDVTLGALAHGEPPHEEVLATLDLDAHGRAPLDGRAPLAVSFNLTELSGMQLQLPGLRCKTSSWPRHKTSFDLALYAVSRAGAYEWVLVHDRGLLSTAGAETLLAEVERALAELVAAPHSPAS
ncbi:MAG: hypothetical protein KC457_07215 [Myxococcales bacterium]|nr:hypothetical protein [Myxococcales bacterium]